MCVRFASDFYMKYDILDSLIQVSTHIGVSHSNPCIYCFPYLFYENSNIVFFDDFGYD